MHACAYTEYYTNYESIIPSAYVCLPDMSTNNLQQVKITEHAGLIAQLISDKVLFRKGTGTMIYFTTIRRSTSSHSII
jgi:hypothetical protein